MKPQPPNNEPASDQEQSFDPLIIIAFLNFHRRPIFGAILLAGIAYYLVQISNPSTVTDDGWAEDAVARDSYTQTEIAPTPGLIDESSANNSAPQVEAATPATTDEKINELLDTAEDWKAYENLSAAADSLEIRIENSNELLQAQDLSPRQRNYCERVVANSTALLSGLANQVDVEELDAFVNEVERNYSKSKDSEIASLADVAWVRNALSKFLTTGSKQDFEVFKNALQKRQTSILGSTRAHQYLTESITEAVSIAGDNAGLKEIAIKHLALSADQGESMINALTIGLFFPRMDLEVLPAQVADAHPEADVDVQFVIDQIRKQPDMPVPIYSILMSSIARYQDVGRSDKAKQCLRQIKEIVPLIKTERIREQVLNGIVAIEAR